MTLFEQNGVTRFIDMDKKISLIVIGGGPGGYVAAIRGAQLGADVTLIEKNRLGGTCLNVGCIPTKALLHAAEIMEEMNHAAEYGIKVKAEGYDWKQVLAKKRAVVNQLVGGVTGLLKANKVKVIEGEAAFTGTKTLSINKKDGKTETLTGDKIIIATGSVPAIPPIPGVQGNPACIDSTSALSLENPPESLLVIGGGVIGMELATAYNAFGTKVTIVEALPKLLPMMDGELTATLRGLMEKKGIEILTEAKVLSVGKSGDKAEVQVDLKGVKKSFVAEKVLVAVGRKTDTAALQLDKAGIRHDRGKIQVNEFMETSVKDVYAIGDCLGQIMLAHIASVQGELAAENALGHKMGFDSKTNPSCVYTMPEFAGVGLTEEGAKEKGIDYGVGNFPLFANGKALIANGGVGAIKILYGKKFNEILGIHILGPRATEMIGEGALALGLEATLEEVIQTIHAHPTVTEAVREAALAAEKRAIHIPNK
ncbi:dihydrolipoyl dehydrogenase [Anaerotignum propionicum]|uniref:dihydrolipoyl dehydrogenase n=1 Tax=Anaerotignum propionicum TaxID=28446 RepID=UPI002ED21478